MTTRTILYATALVILTASAARADEGAKLPPGAIEWKDNPNFVHPPLKCLERNKRIVAYPISAWCFHGVEAAKSPYAEKYVRDFKAIGFNVLIDDERILPYADKVGGVMVQLCSARTTAKAHATFYQSAEKIDKAFFSNPKIGDHPRIQGIILGDNGGGFGDREIRTAAWMKKKYPHVLPIMSLYGMRVSVKSDLRVIHKQSYPWMPGRGRSSQAPKSYCGQLEYDRRFVNKYNMALIECYAGDTSTSRVRYQVHVALAYGAQGLSNFCYSPHRMKRYKPADPEVPFWFKMHRYAIDVLGRHLFGTRCLKVLHSVHGGDHTNAKRNVYAERFHAEQPVVRASEFTLVGLMTPEAKFYSKDAADREVPEYFLVVDKRTSGGEIPGPADRYVMLSKKIAAVELLDPEATKDAKIRKLVPAFKVRMKLDGSNARLLRVAPDLETLLGGAEGLKLYTQINTALAALQWKVTPPAPKPKPAKPETKGKDGKPIEAAPPSVPAEADLPRKVVAAGEIDEAVKSAKAGAARLATVLAAAVKAGGLSQAQADDTLNRLSTAIDATAAEAKSPPKPKM